MTYGDQYDCRSQIISRLIFHHNDCQIGLKEQISPHKGWGAGSPGPAHEYGVVSFADTPTPVKLAYPAPALANIQPVSQQ